MAEPHPIIVALAARRRQRRLSQATVAQRLGYAGKASLVLIEDGRRPATLQFTESYAALLGLRLKVEPASAGRDAAYWRQRAERAEAELDRLATKAATDG